MHTINYRICFINYTGSEEEPV